MGRPALVHRGDSADRRLALGPTNGDGSDDDAVAAYVAKYVTRGANDTGAGTDCSFTTARVP